MENCTVTVAFSYLSTDLLDSPFFLEVLNNSFCNICYSVYGQKNTKTVPRLSLSVNFSNHSKSKAKITLLSN